MRWSKVTPHDLHVQKYVFICYALETKLFLITFYFKVLFMTVQQQVLFLLKHQTKKSTSEVGLCQNGSIWWICSLKPLWQTDRQTHKQTMQLNRQARWRKIFKKKSWYNLSPHFFFLLWFRILYTISESIRDTLNVTHIHGRRRRSRTILLYLK